MLLSNCERMELHQADDLLPNQLLQPTSISPFGVRTGDCCAMAAAG